MECSFCLSRWETTISYSVLGATCRGVPPLPPWLSSQFHHSSAVGLSPCCVVCFRPPHFSVSVVCPGTEKTVRLDAFVAFQYCHQFGIQARHQWLLSLNSVWTNLGIVNLLWCVHQWDRTWDHTSLVYRRGWAGRVRGEFEGHQCAVLGDTACDAHEESC